MVAAYDQLLAQGLVEARKNRGFLRARSRSARRRRSGDGADGTPQAQRGRAALHRRRAAHAPVDATALIRGMFHKVSNKPQPGMGVFPPDWLESTFMPAAVRKVTSTRALQEFSLQYGEPMGDSGLRRALSQKLAALNVHAAPEQIITTVGATHALDIVSRTLLRAGDCVMVEEPGLGGGVRAARRAGHAHAAGAAPRRRARPGGDGALLRGAPAQAVCQRERAPQPDRLLPDRRAARTACCSWPTQHDFHIVEDDTYSHIAPEHATRLCALDGLQRTIYVSGFAKILAPNWRVGFLAAPPALVERLLDTKLLATLTTPGAAGKGAGLCIDQGQLRRHAERIRTRLDAARAPQREAGAERRLHVCGRAGGPVRLGRHRRGHRRAGAAHAGRGLPAGAGRAVPCAARSPAR